tara:strand:- start:1464 stop:1634 length:171 start_codon:yes stop_codon:yes gene_type:complete
MGNNNILLKFFFDAMKLSYLDQAVSVYYPKPALSNSCSFCFIWAKISGGTTVSSGF